MSAAAPGYREALALSLAPVVPLPPQRVQLDQACDRILREPIVAERDLPPFDRATMDGYAVRHDDARPGAPMPVAARIAAGVWHDGAIPRGSAVAIATGAPVPPELDTVIEHERSVPEAPGAPSVTFRSIPQRGASIHRQGSDARAGQTLTLPGVPLRPHLIALAAAVGMPSVLVGPRPRLAMITSGDEVVAVDAAPRRHQVRNSNAALLAALAPALGAVVVQRVHLADDPAAAVAALRDAAARSDVVVTVGGISAGERDPFVAALGELVAEGAAELRVRKAALQPGGPIAVGSLRVAGKPSATFVGLPGNPLSVLVCAHLFLWPIVARLSGAGGEPPGGAWRRVALAARVSPNGRRAAFRPAALLTGDGDGASRAEVLAWSGSGDLAAARASDGVVELPVQENPLPPGSIVPFLPWAGLPAWSAPASMEAPR